MHSWRTCNVYHASLNLALAKGQLISKWNFFAFKFTKNNNKSFKKSSALASKMGQIKDDKCKLLLNGVFDKIKALYYIKYSLISIQ